MTIVSREQWGAKYGRGAPIGGGLGLIVIHHTASPDLSPAATSAKEVDAIRGIERYHGTPRPAGQGWDGIGYSFVVCPSGRAYEGRGWRRAGAHTAGKNSTSYGICFAQNGETRALTQASIEAVREIIAEGLKGGHVAPDYRIDGHRDHAQTECPGKLIYPRLEELRPVAAAPSIDRAEIREALRQARAAIDRAEAAL